MVTSVLACSSDDSAPANPANGTNDAGPGADSGGNGAGDSGTGDGGTNGDGDSAGDAAGPPPAFVVETPQIEIAAGEDVIKCFYLHMPNATDVAVKTWKSTKTVGVGHAALILSKTDRDTPGTVSANGCAMGAADTTWVYSAYKPMDGWSFPADDGAGKPVAKTINAAQPAYVLMHLTNPTAAPIMAKVRIDGIAHPANVATTAAEPYTAFDANMNIAPGGVNETEGYSCDVPAGSKIAWLSTHSRKLTTQTKVSTGASVLFTATNWEDPGALIGAAPFKTFTNDKVDVECTYSNAGGAGTVTAGETVNDEACTLLAYVFPAVKPRLCVNGSLVP